VDIYHAWCDLKPGVSDIAFSEGVTRCKLGFGAPGLGEFHLMIEVRDLRQLEEAFERVAGRREPVEGFHFGVNSLVRNAVFALYRDFPDPFRHRGEEKF
jgi:hypothetical protein